MMLSALRGQGLLELQRELSSLDPDPTDKQKDEEVCPRGTCPGSTPNKTQKIGPPRPALSTIPRIVL